MNFRKVALENFVRSTSPPDFTEFLHSTGPFLPDLHGLYSQMAKVELHLALGIK